MQCIRPAHRLSGASRALCAPLIADRTYPHICQVTILCAGSGFYQEFSSPLTRRWPRRHTPLSQMLPPPPPLSGHGSGEAPHPLRACVVPGRARRSLPSSLEGRSGSFSEMRRGTLLSPVTTPRLSGCISFRLWPTPTWLFVASKHASVLPSAIRAWKRRSRDVYGLRAAS